MQSLGACKKVSQNQAGELTQLNSITSSSASKLSTDILDKALKCMNTLMDLATNNYRNVIIDQVRSG